MLLMISDTLGTQSLGGCGLKLQTPMFLMTLILGLSQPTVPKSNQQCSLYDLRW